jgi:oligopeptide/dipeptide ABC transporter ATP-binding protein
MATNPSQADASIDRETSRSDPVLEVTGLKVYFPLSRGIWSISRTEFVRAVDDVTFHIGKAETLGLVGESGCGKSTTGRAIVGLVRPTSGSIEFRGTELTSLGKRAYRLMRAGFQMVFQDPYSSLDPRATVGDIIEEPLLVHNLHKSSSARKARVGELLNVVGLSRGAASRYPHEFSGGERQRIGIARAISVEPDLIVADEPVSALDVSIRAQITNLLEDLQAKLKISFLFIAHDLAIVQRISQRVAVMYLGRIVEIGTVADVYSHPRHPYTVALLSAIPIADPRAEKARRRIILTGGVPSASNPPSGCAFRTRCWKAQAICAEIRPPLEPSNGGHAAACHFPES